MSFEDRHRAAHAARCPIGKGACGRASALRWSGRRCAPTALRCSGSAARRITRYVRCAHCARTDAASQTHDARCARGREPCASRRPRGAPPPARTRLCRGARCSRRCADARRFWPRTPRSAHRGRRRPAAGDFCGDEKRSAGVGARSAPRDLTRRICPSAESEANGASYAARPRAEHRSAVGAQRRPPQHEPAPAAACREAPHEPAPAAGCRQAPRDEARRSNNERILETR